MTESSEIYKAKEVWNTVDYQGRPVTLSTATVDHIEQQRIEDVSDWPDVMKKVIEDPDIVVQSVKYSDSEVHCKYGADDDTLSDVWLNVPVYYDFGQGNITSAYTAEAHKAGRVIYRKPKP